MKKTRVRTVSDADPAHEVVIVSTGERESVGRVSRRYYRPQGDCTHQRLAGATRLGAVSAGSSVANHLIPLTAGESELQGRPPQTC